MTSKNVGLFEKYRVERVDGKPVEWCFVLQDTDPLAIPALEAYMAAAHDAGYLVLAGDLYLKIAEMRWRHGQGEANRAGEP